MKANGTLIRRKRTELGHGLNRFAALIGLDSSTLSRIENEQRNPRPESLKKIADALGCRITDIADFGITNGDGAEAATSTPLAEKHDSTV